MAHELNTTPVSDEVNIAGTDYLFGAAGSSDPSPQPYTFNAIASWVFGSYSGPEITAAGRAIVAAADTAAQRTTLGLVIGTNVQAYDAELAAIAALTTASYGRSLLTLGSASALASEVDSYFLTPAEGNAAYQPLDAELAAIANLTSAANKVPYFTGSGTAALATLTAQGRALIDDADATAQRGTMGLANSTTAGRLAKYSDTAGAQTQTTGYYEDSSGRGGVGTIDPASGFAALVIKDTGQSYVQSWMDSGNRPVVHLGGSGRIDQHSWSAAGSTSGPVHTLVFHNTSPQNNDLLGHWAAQGADDAGNINTNGYFAVYATTVTQASIDSRLVLGYMDAVVGSPSVAQPNKFVEISKSGVVLPSIPISNASEARIGTTTARSILHVRGSTSNAGGSLGSIVSLYDTNALAAGTGAKIIFGGVYTGSTVTEGAQFGAIKDNATSGEYGFGLNFSTRSHGNVITERLRITGNGNIGIGTTSPSTNLHVNGPVRVGTYTVATLPSAATVGAGSIAYVTDANATTQNSVAAGGGANTVLVFSDGTSWRIS